MSTLLARIGRFLVRLVEPHEHDIDHEAVARHYHQMLGIAQKPVDPATLTHEDLYRWHDGYRAWYDACVAPLMKETP